jgi:hypothetical protein
VYEVQRTFTGTQGAWLDAVNGMENGWVGVICVLFLLVHVQPNAVVLLHSRSSSRNV